METLKEFFERHNLSQAGAAKRLGITQAAVCNHIKGRGMNLKTAVAYNNVLGVPMETLLDRKPQTDKE